MLTLSPFLCLSHLCKSLTWAGNNNNNNNKCNCKDGNNTIPARWSQSLTDHCVWGKPLFIYCLIKQWNVCDDNIGVWLLAFGRFFEEVGHFKHDVYFHKFMSDSNQMDQKMGLTKTQTWLTEFQISSFFWPIIFNKDRLPVNLRNPPQEA